MESFYGARAAGSVPKGEALRTAQVRLLQSEPYAHPYYWAPFILIGNWK